MSEQPWVMEVYDDLTERYPNCPIALLQCTSSYPTHPEDTNLRVMHTYMKEFPRAHVGYSGHEMGKDISIAAVARGARVR